MGLPINVLIIEDSEDDAYLLARELKSAGFDARWSRVETEPGFRVALSAAPDIIFSDYSLPQFSPQRALELLRDENIAVPFIIVSGTIGEEHAVEIVKAGATDYLLKNRMQRLKPVVERALRESQERLKRKLTEEELRESEARFRQLAENINEVFWMTDVSKNKMLYVSPAYEKVWGRSCESVYSNPASWLESIHLDDRARIYRAITLKQVAGTYDEEYRIMRPDNSVRWVSDRAFPVRNHNGEVQRIVGVAADITERRKLQEEFRQSQKMEAVGQLASGVAHDFNNVLAVIQMQTDLILAEGNLSPRQHEFAEGINRASKHAANLTRQLLMYGRRSILQPRELDLNETVRHLSKMLQRFLGEDVKMFVKFSTEPLFVHADPSMMDQVLMNLSVNSRDAMPKGGELRVEISAVEFDEASASECEHARAGSFVCLSVSDTGAGIAPEIMPKIFDPFFTTKDVGKGTGLGLATVFGIVQQHHGWINVQSEVGMGTTFKVFVPRLVKIAVEKKPESALKEANGGNETVLLVEDDTFLRALIENALSYLGYRVLQAASGVQALKVWGEHQKDIQLLVTDLIMPDGMNGRELAEILSGENPKLKVLFTSGYSADIMGRNFEIKEGLNFLTKPYELSALASAVRNCLDHAPSVPGGKT
jgi:PAS domain S-box-containing protein